MDKRDRDDQTRNENLHPSDRGGDAPDQPTRAEEAPDSRRGRFYDRAIARLSESGRNPYRTMYGNGRDPKLNPAMAAASRLEPSAIAHASWVHDGNRTDGAQGVRGQQQFDSDEGSHREENVLGAGWATTDGRGGRGGRGERG